MHPVLKMNQSLDIISRFHGGASRRCDLRFDRLTRRVGKVYWFYWGTFYWLFEEALSCMVEARSRASIIQGQLIHLETSLPGP